MKIKVKINVEGLVQGVGYRYYCCRKALEYGITGGAKNLPDGNVEIIAEGEKSILLEFINELKIGPSRAKVSCMNILELPYENEYEDFSIY